MRTFLVIVIVEAMKHWGIPAPENDWASAMFIVGMITAVVQDFKELNRHDISN